uniref:Uncharacterized protein n=1 Tax=Anguilla anguilla TaxID=7936 RepID=A0A0E9RST5_ANGAN
MSATVFCIFTGLQTFFCRMSFYTIF